MSAPKDPLKNIEWRKKISEHNLKTGKIPPSRKGISPSKETRLKQSETMKKIGFTPPNLKGTKKTQEFKDKVKKNHSHFWKGKKGKLSAGYIDGRTSSNHLIRNSLEMKLWKKACLERDNFTCQKYRTHGGRLEVHHINNFADFPELRLSISNGITLSKKAHDEFHKIYGRRNNTLEQLQEFIKK